MAVAKREGIQIFKFVFGFMGVVTSGRVDFDVASFAPLSHPKSMWICVNVKQRYML